MQQSHVCSFHHFRLKCNNHATLTFSTAMYESQLTSHRQHISTCYSNAASDPTFPHPSTLSHPPHPLYSNSLSAIGAHSLIGLLVSTNTTLPPTHPPISPSPSNLTPIPVTNASTNLILSSETGGQS